MALRSVTTQGTLTIPQAAATFKVASRPAGLATSGVIAILGESTMGPSFDIEDDVEEDCSFGPDQIAQIEAKYGSGPLVTAARAAAQPSNDPRITGSPARLVLLKTNASTKADGSLTKFDDSNYGTLADKSYGKTGNLISIEVTADTSEVEPTTGAFTYIPAVGTVAYTLRLNGGAGVGGTLGANTDPATFVSTLAALAGVNATGGANLGVHPASGNIALTVLSGNAVQIDTTVALGAIPPVGSTMVIPDASVIEGGGGLNANVGAYVVTGASALQILATKLSDAGKPAAVPGTITPPSSVGTVALSGGPAADIKAFGSVTIGPDTLDPIAGIGKTLEINQLTSGTDLLSRAAYVLGTTSKVSLAGSGNWISATGAETLLESSAEYVVNISAARQFDGRSEELIAGGEIGLTIGYTGTTAALVIDDDDLTITVVGGSGASLGPLDLGDYATIADLAEFISTHTGYTASAGTAALGQLPPTALDNVTTTCATTFGNETCKLKVDAYRLFNKISDTSSLVELQNSDGDVEQAGAGLPQPASRLFLSGGALGGTTAAQFVDAVSAAERVRCNFVVPCFSRDASDDIVDGLTDSASTYEISAIHAAIKTHVNAMSTLKRKKNRQGFCSIQDTFTAAKAASANLASFRVSMAFQDGKVLGSSGLTEQTQPWVLAAVAAGMQAAGFYRPIVRKQPNLSGVIQAAGDFDDRDDTEVEEALENGLLVVRRPDTGGLAWVSDQTTHVKDDNFVYNSIQAVYVADTISMTLSQRLDGAFVGESIADVPAALIASAIDAAMGDFIRLKLVSTSDDAPKGYKGLRVDLDGPTATVQMEIKEATGIYFIPIELTFSAVQQTAGG